MAEPAHSLDMNEECCNDILTYCPREACSMLLRGKCMETLYLLDRQYHPTYNGTLLQVSWHPIGHPLPDYEEHRRCLLSPYCEAVLCRAQDTAVPSCDPELLPHICPTTTVPPSTTPMYTTTTTYYTTEPTSQGPARSAESGQASGYPQGMLPMPVNPSYIPPNMPMNNIPNIPRQNTGYIPPRNPYVYPYVPPSLPVGSPQQPVSNIPQNTPERVNGQNQNQEPSNPTPVETPPESQPSPPANPPPEEPTPQEGQGGPETSSDPYHGGANDQTANKMNLTDTSGNTINTQPGRNVMFNGNNEKIPVSTAKESTTKSFQWQPLNPNATGIQQDNPRRVLRPQVPKIQSAKGRNSSEKMATSTTSVNGDNGIGAGRQADFIQGRQPFFTVNKDSGLSGASTSPTDLPIETSTLGGASNEVGGLDEKILAGGIVGGALLAILMVCLTICCVKRRKDKSGASTTSSHRQLHLQYSGFPLDSDLLNDPMYKSSMKSGNGPPPIPYRPPPPQISYINSFREPTNFVGSGEGGVSFEEQSESNDYEELPCDIDPAVKEAYKELVDAPRHPTSRTVSNVSNASSNRHVKIRSVPTLYDVNRKNIPNVVRRNPSAVTIKSASSMRHSGRPLPARPANTLPRTMEGNNREVYEPIGLMETPHGYEIPVNLSNHNLAMLGLLDFPNATTGYDVGAVVNQGRQQALVSNHGAVDEQAPDYFVLERQDELPPISTVSGTEYLEEPENHTYTTASENSYSEVGHEYLELERSVGGWTPSNHHLPHDIHL